MDDDEVPEICEFCRHASPVDPLSDVSASLAGYGSLWYGIESPGMKGMTASQTAGGQPQTGDHTILRHGGVRVDGARRIEPARARQER